MSDKQNKEFDFDIPKKPWTKQATWFGILVIIIFVGGFGAWAIFAPLESAAIAPGKITVAGNRRTIQHLEGGIVKTINVRDGAIVKKGDELVKLDDTRTKIALRLHQNEVYELLAIESRLLAERDKSSQINFSPRLFEMDDKAKSQELIDSQKSIFEAQMGALNSSIDILEQRIVQLNQQIKGIQSQMAALDKQIKYVDEEVKSTQYLEKKKLIERPRLLALQREAAKLRGSKGESVAKVSELKQKIGETQLQMTSMKKERHKEIVTELRETQQKLAEARNKEDAAKDVLQRTSIKAPQDGAVVGLKIHTKGGVVKPGDSIMDIVPSQDALVIEARVSPLDIDVVHTGLVAKVQLTAFKMRTTPTMLGKVTRVSADVFTDEKSGESYFTARVQIDKGELSKLPKGADLHPGMPVQVMIITAKLTPWQYFITPIKASFERAFREQ